nr:immunoglobulin light chain junction region [Macaca mulatta]MOY10926.1 immunoglobulin light chain junction region [Macaca mulatta]MOY11141.1 immunoglobulin light chain junction region [Macaca mulatta]MOY11269.1 immunoglobulin light chain junction region [Macaca mulatta]MOY11939.1 immunoglobulin light chain junction region [Macaca mulatta]
CYQRNSGYTF